LFATFAGIIVPSLKVVDDSLNGAAAPKALSPTAQDPAINAAVPTIRTARPLVHMDKPPVLGAMRKYVADFGNCTD
jgi:hypothetical protein